MSKLATFFWATRNYPSISRGKEKSWQIVVTFVSFAALMELHTTFGKAHIFWEGHKILWNLDLTFDPMYCSQKEGEDSQNFVAFSEYMNFTLRRPQTKTTGA